MSSSLLLLDVFIYKSTAPEIAYERRDVALRVPLEPPERERDFTLPRTDLSSLVFLLFLGVRYVFACFFKAWWELVIEVRPSEIFSFTRISF